MFANKQDFINTYTTRMAEKYGRSIEGSHITEQYLILGEMVRDYASTNWRESKEKINKNETRQMFYFSMEFLIGRLLTSNMMNLGIYDVASEGLAELGLDINQLENVESDAGLGNGGLGRLAACFLDSLASLNLPGHGNCIRYQYGLFKQLIIDGKQVEVPDLWLKYENPWEIRKPKHAVEVKFWGDVKIENAADGKMEVKIVNSEVIRAVPYDIPVVGYNTKSTNFLRLWQAEAAESSVLGKDFREYIHEVNEICQNVYPDDSTEEGKILRLKQEYFFVSAGLQSIIRSHMRNYGTLDNFVDKVCIQMNDTHPVMVIPEMMRILLDEYRYSWDNAWSVVTKTVAYTNHTVMAEALEHWPAESMKRLLPRIYMIIEEINRRFINDILVQYNDHDLANRVAVIRDGQVFMANLAIIAAFSVNGVAKLHTQILKEDVMKDFYHIFPNKFNNKTNGITHRRWLLYSNPELSQLIENTIGASFRSNPADLIKLLDHVDDPKLQKAFLAVKKQRKEILAQYIQRIAGVNIDTDSIFDIQAKRLHAYKRQLLNALHIIYLYQQIKNNPDFKMQPRTFLFAAKAAPAYTLAKKIIELICALQKKINADEQVNKYIKVVFLPNYNVSLAEILLNAADVSEQISTAGKEASGTGNMKFMMNGAITLGTYDGANVEIDELVGSENDVIFGMRVEDVDQLRLSNYNSKHLYLENPDIKAAVDSLIDGTWSDVPNEFQIIYDDLIFHNDEFFVLADFEAYCQAQKEIERRYLDQSGWARSCLVNIAKSGHFSSDRTISEYAKEIWHLEPYKS